MIIFGKKSREAMIPIIEEEDKRIDKLQQEYDELRDKLSALEEKLDAACERRNDVARSYGIGRDYADKSYFLIKDYAKEVSD